MELILHLGAHRTGTKTFQDYLRRNAKVLAASGISFGGPRCVRSKHGQVWPKSDASDTPRLLQGNLSEQLAQANRSGVKKFLISDENMIGSVRNNLRHKMLYPNAGDRMARFADAFGGQVDKIIFTPRCLDRYWCSALAYGVSRGQSVPSRETREKIAIGRRGWRDVICDIASVLPGAAVRVLPFEKFVGRPDLLLSRGADVEAKPDGVRSCLNKSPTLPELRRVLSERGNASAVLPFGMGRWNPFTNEEHTALRELYADDMMWLTAGADGLATLIEDRRENRTGQTPSLAATDKGQFDEYEEKQVARPG